MTSAGIWISRSADETFAFATALGAVLEGGVLIALDGPLGAGKTRFVQGLAAGLGVPRDEPIISPTFVLAREYAGRLRLVHFDAYRLADEEEMWSLGFDELRSDPQVVTVVEWASRVPSYQSDADIVIMIRPVAAEIRRFEIATDSGTAEKLQELFTTWGVHPESGGAGGV